MLLTIFGASGNIGKLLVSKALHDGHTVKAYVRTPSKIDFSHPNLMVIQGELNDFNKI